MDSMLMLGWLVCLALAFPMAEGPNPPKRTNHLSCPSRAGGPCGRLRGAEQPRRTLRTG